MRAGADDCADSRAARASRASAHQLPSRDGHTTLIPHLFRPAGDESHAAIVMLHGCSGLWAKSGRFLPIHRGWASSFLNKGDVVFVVDSATSRRFGQTCSTGTARRTMWRERTADAYAALQYRRGLAL